MFKLSFFYFYVIRIRDKIMSLMFEEYKYFAGEKWFGLPTDSITKAIR